MKNKEAGKGKKRGRPSSYSEEIAQEICALVASSTKGLELALKDRADLPDHSTIYRWLAAREDFREHYARAREHQAEIMAQEIIAIADETSNDTTIIGDGDDGACKEIQNHEWINRSRLRVDARKWLASKLAPKKYGDKIQQELSGSVGITPIFELSIKKGE